MPQIIVDMDDEEDKTVGIYKIMQGHDTKEKTIKWMIRRFEKSLKIKKAFEKMKELEKEGRI